MPHSPKIPPVGPEPLDLVNRMRQVKLNEFHEKLDRMRNLYPDMYIIVADFLLSCKPEPPIHDRK